MVAAGGKDKPTQFRSMQLHPLCIRLLTAAILSHFVAAILTSLGAAILFSTVTALQQRLQAAQSKICAFQHNHSRNDAQHHTVGLSTPITDLSLPHRGAWSRPLPIDSPPHSPPSAGPGHGYPSATSGSRALGTRTDGRGPSMLRGRGGEWRGGVGREGGYEKGEFATSMSAGPILPRPTSSHPVPPRPTPSYPHVQGSTKPKPNSSCLVLTNKTAMVTLSHLTSGRTGPHIKWESLPSSCSWTCPPGCT